MRQKKKKRRNPRVSAAQIEKKVKWVVAGRGIPRHSLDKAFAKVVEGNGDLHVLVLSVGVAVAEQHDLVVVSHVIVGDGDGGGPVDGVDEPVVAVGQRAVVDPDVAPAEDGHAVAVRDRPPPVVPRRVPHVGVPSLLAVVDVEPVNYDVGHELDGDARPAGNVDAGAAAVEGLEGVHDQLLLQLDRHVALEDDPERLVLDDRVAERPGLGVDGVVVARVGDHVDLAVAAPDGVLAEPDGAVGEALAVLLPVGVAPPAVVDRVPGPAGEVPQAPPIPSGIGDAPAARRRHKHSPSRTAIRHIRDLKRKPHNTTHARHEDAYLCTSCTTSSGSWTGEEEMGQGARREARRRRRESAGNATATAISVPCLLALLLSLLRE